MRPRSFHVFFPALLCISFMILSNTLAACSPSLNPPVGIQTSPTAHQGPDNLPTPWWWSGNCDTDNYSATIGVPAKPLASWRNVFACEPRPLRNIHLDNTVHFTDAQGNDVGEGEFEWECVELSMRYMYLAYGIIPYDAPTGDVVVDNYQQHNTNAILIPVTNNGSSHTSPQPGDILSYNAAVSPNHTSVVIGSKVDNTGSGEIKVLEQNFSSTGTATLYVGKKAKEPPWVVAGVKNWLHHTVDLFPQTALPKTKVMIRGKGFGINEQVKITVDNTVQIDTTTTDRTGAFSTTITIPSSLLPGTHTVQVTGQTSGFSPQTVFYVATTPQSTLPMPPTQTSCPASDTARAAVTRPLALEKDQNVVYFENKPVSRANSNFSITGIFYRYDVTTRHTTQIVSMSNMQITQAQISADGEWILFVGVDLGTDAYIFQLRMIRLDGQGLQTLYCFKIETAMGGIYNIQWSPDQKSVVFNEDQPQAGDLYLLNMENGDFRLMLMNTYSGNDEGYQVETWLDNTLVVVNAVQPVGPRLRILDIRKGANQQADGLQPLLPSYPPCPPSFTNSAAVDSTRSIVYFECAAGLSGNQLIPPFTISKQSGEGIVKRIYSSSTMLPLSVQVIPHDSLMLNMETVNGIESGNDSLWVMHSDGSGLKQVISTSELDRSVGIDPNGDTAPLATNTNQFSQYPWSNASRDGNMYSEQVWSLAGAFPCKLLVSSLNGGQFITAIVTPNNNCSFVTTSDSVSGSLLGLGDTTLGMVGWTTM